jgi:hypothetical protein
MAPTFRLARWGTPRLLIPASAVYVVWRLLPYLMLLAFVSALLSRRRGGRRRSPGLGLAVFGLIGAYLGLRRQERNWGPSWHPCEQCGQPIERPSRAHYCSQACRRYARIRREAAAIAEEVPF